MSLLLSLAGGIPMVGTASAASNAPVGFGMEMGSTKAQADAGVPPDYGMFWVGPWTLKHGWGGPDSHMDKARSQGVTPVIQFYYWGDDISQNCIENGCWSSLHNSHKNKQDWQKLAQQLTNHLWQRMGGEEAVVILETEFNKGNVATYEPLDGYLADKARFIKAQYPAATVVMGLGNWGHHAWPTWDRAASASDWVGIQGLRGSTRDSLDHYYGIVDATIYGANRAKSLYGKPVMVTDVALSTYPEPEYLHHQAEVLKNFFERFDELKQAGLTAFMYRSLWDNPSFDLNNYYGEAERYWGLVRAHDRSHKPGFDVWKSGVQAERGKAPSSTTPTGTPLDSAQSALVEAEAFTTKTAGGQQWDSSASSDHRWNLWSNGHIQHSFDVREPGTYTFTVRALGQELDGVAPRMVVSMDGAPVHEVRVPAGGWSTHEVPVEISSTGTHTLRIAYTNDAASSYGDRNLLLDKVDAAKTATNGAPQAAFTMNCEGQTCRVDGSGSSDPDGDALTYAWDFGDGATATGATASHTYADAGTYQVTLTVDDGQARDAATQSATATSPGVAVDSSATTGVEAEAFAKKSAGGKQWDSTASNNNRWNLWSNGHIEERFDVQEPGTYRIDVRAQGQELDGVAPRMVVSMDGAPVHDTRVPAGGWSDQSVTVEVAEAGTHTLRIAFTNDAATSYGDRNLLLDRVDWTWQAPNSAPQAAFTVECRDLTCSTDASSASDPDGDALTYAWDFGDGTTATGATATHTYSAGGNYTVELTVTDPDGASDTAQETATAVEPNHPPSAAFTLECQDRTCTVDASGSSDPDGDALTYAWDFGDGATAQGVDATHTYADPGTYPVTLTVSDGTDQDTARRDANPTAPAPSGQPSAPVTVEAEAFAKKSAGGKQWDSTASDNTRWNLWSNGHIEHSFDVTEAGTHTFVVRAQGQELDGIAPRMVVSLDGQRIQADSVRAGGWQDHSFAVDIPTAGSHTLRIAFTNDARTSYGDRNLLLDKVEWTQPAASGPSGVAVTPATAEAESFAAKSAGGKQWDSTASENTRWNLWSNGHIEHSFDVQEPGTYRIDVRAQGQQLDGVAPNMVVRLDGAKVHETRVSAGGWQDHSVTVDVAQAGSHTLHIAYTNDARTSYGDRNLLLDKVEWRQAAP